MLQVDTLEISLKEQLDMVDRYSARISTLSLLENDFEVVPGGSHCDPQRPSKASDVGTP